MKQDFCKITARLVITVRLLWDYCETTVRLVQNNNCKREMKIVQLIWILLRVNLWVSDFLDIYIRLLWN